MGGVLGLGREWNFFDVMSRIWNLMIPNSIEVWCDIKKFLWYHFQTLHAISLAFNCYSTLIGQVSSWTFFSACKFPIAFCHFILQVIFNNNILEKFSFFSTIAIKSQVPWEFFLEALLKCKMSFSQYKFILFCDIEPLSWNYAILYFFWVWEDEAHNDIKGEQLKP